MWGRKSVYGRHVEQNQKKISKPQKKTTQTSQKQTTQKSGNTLSDFEKEYYAFIEKMKNITGDF